MLLAILVNCLLKDRSTIHQDLVDMLTERWLICGVECRWFYHQVLVISWSGVGNLLVTCWCIGGQKLVDNYSQPILAYST